MAKVLSKKNALASREIASIPLADTKSGKAVAIAFQRYLARKHIRVVWRAIKSKGKMLIVVDDDAGALRRSRPPRSVTSVESGVSSSGAVVRARAAYRALEESSLTVAQASRILAVDESRVRQRLGPTGDLYGFKSAGEWRIPAFHFEPDGQLIRHLGKIARALPTGLTPLEVAAWLSRPHPDLSAPEAPGEDLTPSQWLTIGRDSELLLKLAKYVGVS